MNSVQLISSKFLRLPRVPGLLRVLHTNVYSGWGKAASLTLAPVTAPLSTPHCNRYINTIVTEEANKPSFFKRIMKGIGITSVYEAKLKVSGLNLYEAIADKLDYKYWITENKMGDNFMSWFLITELHIWMLLVRSMMESEDGRIVRNSTIEALWADVGIRSVKYHPGSRSLVRKQVQTLSEEFQAALVSYDEGLVTNDMVLAGAVWRRFFLMNKNVDPQLIENIVRYIRRQLYELEGIPKKELFFNPDIKWIPLK